MANAILQTFLDRNLLDLGEARDKFDYLTKAAQDIREKLRADPGALVSATSVLLGGEIPATDSTYQLCDAAVKQHWETYRSRFVSGADMLFRAALLHAIDTLVSIESDEYAAIVYYTATGLLPRLSSRKEADLFKTLYDRCAQRVEVAANRLWNPEATTREDLPGVLASLAPGDSERLAKLLIKAGTAAPTGDNPHAMANSPAEWVGHFGKGAAEAIRGALQLGFKDLGTKLWSGFEESFARRAEAARLRSNLLYWKTALFHEGSQQSFRTVAPDLAILYLADDLQRQIPHLHPKSVEYFLRETVGDALGHKEAEETVTLEGLCERVAEKDVHLAIRLHFRPNGRVTPGEAIVLSAARAAPVSQALTLTALPATTAYSRVDLALEIFRAAQVARLTQRKGGA